MEWGLFFSVTEGERIDSAQKWEKKGSKGGIIDQFICKTVMEMEMEKS